MKICIVGTGGVGGYFGARLAADNNDVVFVARGAHRAAMERDGLKVLSDLGDVTIPAPKLHDGPETTGLCDVILLCVKLWDSVEALSLIRPLLSHDTPVISLQNGVEAEGLLAAKLGVKHVMGGVSRISASIESPGVIRHLGNLAQLTFGEMNGASSWRQEMLLSACIGAGIEAEIAPDINVEIWRKFVFLAPLAGATCFYRRRAGALREDTVSARLFADLVHEAAAVGRAQGIGLPDGTEEEIIANLSRLPAEMPASMLLDLEAGRRLELDWLTGAVVRLGAEAGVATPESQKVYNALAPVKEGRAA